MVSSFYFTSGEGLGFALANFGAVSSQAMLSEMVYASPVGSSEMSIHSFAGCTEIIRTDMWAHRITGSPSWEEFSAVVRGAFVQLPSSSVVTESTAACIHCWGNVLWEVSVWDHPVSAPGLHEAGPQWLVEFLSCFTQSSGAGGAVRGFVAKLGWLCMYRQALQTAERGAAGARVLLPGLWPHTMPECDVVISSHGRELLSRVDEQAAGLLDAMPPVCSSVDTSWSWVMVDPAFGMSYDLDYPFDKFAFFDETVLESPRSVWVADRQVWPVKVVKGSALSGFVDADDVPFDILAAALRIQHSAGVSLPEAVLAAGAAEL